MAQRLRRYRLKRDLTASEVARGVGVAVSTYREWELGRQIKGEPYFALAKILQVSLSELMGGSESQVQRINSELEEIEKAIARIRVQL